VERNLVSEALFCVDLMAYDVQEEKEYKEIIFIYSKMFKRNTHDIACKLPMGEWTED